jgi:TRAP-type C4-dicarboxylate transport system substrate-binding protein
MIRSVLIPVLAAAALAGCGAETSDRAGGSRPVEAKVLVMANANDDLEELAAFDAAVRRVSGGRLRIAWRNEYARGRGGNAEVAVIRDVSAGKADLGWAGTRSFDLVGDPAFNPLHAPLLIGTHADEERVVRAALVEPMLAGLADIGLRGIGVLPGPLRRPLGRRTLLEPEDWDGAVIASSGGRQIDASLRALGATVRYNDPAVTEPTAGLDGIETHVAAIPGNHYHRDMRNLTGNVVLWPRPLVLFAGPDVADADLAVLRRAAEAAISGTAALARARDNDARQELCRNGIAVATATPAQVAALRAAFRPVLDGLERDPAARSSIAQIRRLVAGSRPDAVTCPAAAAPARTGTIPAGLYRTRVTRADAAERGFTWASVVEADPNPAALRSKTKEYRIELSEQSTFTVYDVTVDGRADIGWEGSYSLYRDRITVEGNEGTTITARVEVDGDRLRFVDVQPGPRTPEAFTWGAAPFVKMR